MSPLGMGPLDEGCLECDLPAGGLTIGNGKCNKCHGTGIDSLIGAIASFGSEKCERCGGDGVCPRCNGWGYHPGSGRSPYPRDGGDDASTGGDAGGSSGGGGGGSDIPAAGCLIIGVLLLCSVIAAILLLSNAVTYAVANWRSILKPKATPTPYGLVNASGFPVCKDTARPFYFKENPVVELEAHDNCMSGVFMMPVGPGNIHFEHLGSTPNAWFQVVYWNATVSEVMFKDDPRWAEGTGPLLQIPHHSDDGFRIVGNGRKRITYEKLPR